MERKNQEEKKRKMITDDQIEDDDRISWRGDDPEQMFSDWTIQVRTNSESVEVKTTCYYVHRCILALGPRKSVYFNRLFRSTFSESKERTSRITLDADSASMFPVMLDFIYSAREEKDKGETDAVLDIINTQNICVLLSLGQVRRGWNFINLYLVHALL